MNFVDVDCNGHNGDIEFPLDLIVRENVYSKSFIFEYNKEDDSQFNIEWREIICQDYIKVPVFDVPEERIEKIKEEAFKLVDKYGHGKISNDQLVHVIRNGQHGFALLGITKVKVVKYDH